MNDIAEGERFCCEHFTHDQNILNVLTGPSAHLEGLLFDTSLYILVLLLAPAGNNVSKVSAPE